MIFDKQNFSHGYNDFRLYLPTTTFNFYIRHSPIETSQRVVVRQPGLVVPNARGFPGVFFPADFLDERLSRVANVAKPLNNFSISGQSPDYMKIEMSHRPASKFACTYSAKLPAPADQG